MEWILHSDVVGLYLSGKDSASNPSKMTQVSPSISTDMCVRARARAFSYITHRKSIT